LQVIRSFPQIALVTVIAASMAVAQGKPSAQKKINVTGKAVARAAQVTYTGGQLSVVADNNSLAETLAEIRELTKARVEGVQPAPAEKISGEFGPDTPRAVVGALLASSHYNFILVSPPGSPGSLQRIVLSEPAPEPVAAAAPMASPALDHSPEVKPTPAEDQQSDSASKDTAPKDAGSADSPAAEKDTPGTASETNPRKETKPESNSSTNEPAHETAGNQSNVPPTVEICGVTYTAAQLADLRVPDHCGKPAPQPNSTSGSKQSN